MTPRDVRIFRAKNDLTQAGLAELLGLSAQTIWAYEAGRQKIPTFIELAIKKLDDDVSEKPEAV